MIHKVQQEGGGGKTSGVHTVCGSYLVAVIRSFLEPLV